MEDKNIIIVSVVSVILIILFIFLIKKTDNKNLENLDNLDNLDNLNNLENSNIEDIQKQIRKQLFAKSKKQIADMVDNKLNIIEYRAKYGDELSSLVIARLSKLYKNNELTDENINKIIM